MLRRIFGIVVILVTLAACGAGPFTGQSDPRPQMARAYDLTGFSFAARPDLTVSESNQYYPSADIVWRGDPAGDRIVQIEALFAEAVRRNLGTGDALTATRSVTADIVLERFHGLTQRAQFSTGGVYNIVFHLTVRDAATGDVIEPARRIVANLDAWDSAENARLEQAGVTQKMRVTDFLTDVLRQQLRE